MIDDETILSEFGGVTRLFPLPNLVLYPQVIQGLHIFEPRYRQMMADALGSDMLVSLALLCPGWEDDYDARPAVQPIICIGRLVWHERLSDGRFNLRLRGVSRARIIEELDTDRFYRTARVTLIAEVAHNDLSKLTDLRRKLAEEVLPRFSTDGHARQQLDELFSGDLPLGRVCDILAYALPFPLDLKQSLLAEPDAAIRAEIMTNTLQASNARAGRPFPPDFSSN